MPSESRATYRRRRIVMTVMLLAVAAVLAGVLYAVVRVANNLFGSPADYSGSGTGSVQVQIHQGDSLSQIGVDLASAGVVKSAKAFADAASQNSRADSIGPGYYRLRLHMKASLALALLLDPHSLVTSRITIPEGRRLRDILAAIAAASNISLSDLTKAAGDPAALGVPSWGAGHSLEGFLFPATYDFAPGTTATQALKAMVSRFDQEAASINLVADAHQIGYSPYQVLTLASIVEREGRLTADFPKIAEVFYNRLKDQMPLGSDATLYYVLPAGTTTLTQADLQLNSPYNTRTNKGLPPSPIASPGEASLLAALHPAKGPYLYFVTIDKAGHAAFATTLQRFNELVAQSKANGVQ